MAGRDTGNLGTWNLRTDVEGAGVVGRMVAFVLAVTLLLAAIGFVSGELILGSGPAVAAVSGVVGLMLGAALWSTRRQGETPVADVDTTVGKGRRTGRASGKGR